MEKGKQFKSKLRHSVMIDERKKCVITGIADIAGFHEKEIVLKLDDSIMVIAGDSLHIGSLHVEEGKLDICGTISSIAYETPHTKLRSIWGCKRK